MSKILLINDMPGYGKVAFSAMIPVLSHMGYELFNLPTAVVSNTLDYGKFDILATTDSMKRTIGIWDELGFDFDAVSTGFIVSEEQARIIAEFCQKKAESGTLIFTDPIMGDEGQLYNGVTEDTVSHMRNLISVSDCCVPNYTEAVCLSGAEYRADGASEEELRDVIDRLLELGAHSVVITSCQVAGEQGKCVMGYDHKGKQYFKIGFQEIPIRFPGTGDIFSAVLLGRVLGGSGLCESTKAAMDTVSEMIRCNADNADKYKGIPLESCLDLIERGGNGR